MADSILRLQVESQEYDAKLKRATEGLQRYVDGCRKMGGTLEVVEQDTLDYVKALGQMDSVSRTATGKLAEMTKTFTELSVQYQRLTNEEKQTPFGKALADSLDQLKGRIGESKMQLDDVKQSINGGNGLTGTFDNLAGKIGINTSALGKLGLALGAATAAFELAKGAIQSTEAGHDALARAIAVTENVTNQFLRTLATADFSSFISGLQGVIDKTIEAYNAMDEFESYAARFQPWQTAKEGEIQTKLMQARAAKAQGDKKKAEQLTNEAKALIEELAASTKAYGEKQTKGGYSTIRSLMGGVEITDSQIAWYANPKNWEEAQRKAQKYADTMARIKELSKESTSPRRRNETEMGYAMRTGAAATEKRMLEEMLRNDPSLKRAYTMQNLRDSGDSDQAQAFRRALGDIYGNTLANSRIESLRARADRMDGVISRGGGGSTKQEQAQKMVDAALLDYKQTIEKATMEFNSGLIKEEDVKKRTLSAQESLYTAYGKAYAIFANPEYKDAQDKCAAEITQLGGSIKALRDATEAAKQTMQKGVSGFNSATMSEWTKYRNADLSQATYGTQEYADIIANIADMNTIKTILEQSLRAGIDAAQFDLEPLWEKVFDGQNIDDSVWKNMVDTINRKLKEMKLDPIQLDFNTGKLKSAKDLNTVGEKTKGTWKDAASAVSSLGSALQSLEDPGAKVAGIIGQSIANIALSFSQALSKSAGPWDWIAAAIAGTATMISTIAAIKSATAGSYAEGGVVEGSSFAGDRLYARVNSGETILTRLQAERINESLDAAPIATGANFGMVLRGEDLVAAIINTGSRQGRRGEKIFIR